jgi:hypothetical protein
MERRFATSVLTTLFFLFWMTGYLSMLLSEILPPAKVQRLVLMDKAWALHNVTPQSHHMSAAHIYGKYYSTWPIPLVTSKQDFKSGAQRRHMEAKYFQQGPVILLAVHLCGTLSLKAVDFFNHNPAVQFFCLKPCCLPGMIHARRHEIFEFTTAQQPVTTTTTRILEKTATAGEVNASNPSPPNIESPSTYHSFPATTVCMPGKWNKNQWKGPKRTKLQSYFQTWAHNLYLGIATTDVTPQPRASDAGSTCFNNSDGAGGVPADETCNKGKKNEDANDEMDTTNRDKQPEQQQHQQQLQRCHKGPKAYKVQKRVAVQTEGGYQNEFLLAQRCPTTDQVWGKLLLDELDHTRVHGRW